MEVTIRLDADRAQKLEYLLEHSQQNPTELLAQAIDETYQALNPNSKTAYQLFEEIGLVGCMNGTEELPETDEPEIRAQLEKKRAQERL